MVWLKKKLMWFCTFTPTSAHTHTQTNNYFTLVILGWEQRLFPVEAYIHPPLSERSNARWGFAPLVHSCLREHFLSWTHQPHSNLGLAFRHTPQLSRNALHLYKCAAKKSEKKKKINISHICWFSAVMLSKRRMTQKANLFACFITTMAHYSLYIVCGRQNPDVRCTVLGKEHNKGRPL